MGTQVRTENSLSQTNRSKLKWQSDLTWKLDVLRVLWWVLSALNHSSFNITLIMIWLWKTSLKWQGSPLTKMIFKVVLLMSILILKILIFSFNRLKVGFTLLMDWPTTSHLVSWRKKSKALITIKRIYSKQPIWLFNFHPVEKSLLVIQTSNLTLLWISTSTDFLK
mgnify:CR=1 FL=1